MGQIEREISTNAIQTSIGENYSNCFEKEISVTLFFGTFHDHYFQLSCIDRSVRYLDR